MKIFLSLYFLFAIVNAHAQLQVSITSGSGTTICQGSSTSLTANVNNSNGTPVYSWSESNETSNTILVSPSSTTTYTVTVVSGAETATNQIVILLNQAPQDSASQGIGICPNKSAQLSASSGSSFSWSPSSGLDYPNIASPIASPSVTTTYTVTFTDANNCTLTRSFIVTVDSLPTANAGIDRSICHGSTITLNASGGLFYNWSNPTTLNNPNDASPIASPMVSTTYTLTVTSLNGCSNTDDVQITVYPNPIADAGSDKSICQGSSVIIGGTPTAFGGTPVYSYDWNASFFISNPTVAPNISTTYTLQINDDNGCTDIDTVIVSVTPNPTVNAGADISSCASISRSTKKSESQSSPNDIPLFGMIGGGASSASWTSSGTGTFIPDNTHVDGIYSPSTEDIIAGMVTLTLTTNPNGFCNVVSDQMTITINNVPTISAGSDISRCSNSPTANLQGSIGGSASSATWSTSGSGTFDNIALLNAKYSPSAQDILNGSVNLTLTSNDPIGPCDTVKDQLVVSIIPSGSVNAGLDENVCSSNPEVTLHGIIGGGASTGTWSSSGSGIFSPANNSLYATYTPSSNDLILGYVTITLQTDEQATCASQSDQMIITINPAVTVNAGGESKICNTATEVALSGIIGGSATSAAWSNGAGSYNPNANSLNAIYTPTASEKLAGFVDLVLTTDDPTGVCGLKKSTKRITFGPPSTFLIGPDITICSNSDAQILSQLTSGNPTISWTGGSGTFSNPNSIKPIYTPSQTERLGGDVLLSLTINDSANGCGSVTTQLKVVVKPEIFVEAGDESRVCQTATEVPLSGIIGGSATHASWSNGAGSFNPDTNSLQAIYTPTSGEKITGFVELILTATDSTGVCGLKKSTKKITFSPQSTFLTGSDITICSYEDAQLLSKNYSGSPVISWLGGSGTFSDPTIINPIYTPSAAERLGGDVFLSLTIDDSAIGCGSVTGQLKVTVRPPLNVDLGPDVILESNEWYTGIYLTAPAGFSYLWKNGDTTQTTYAAYHADQNFVRVTDSFGCFEIDSILVFRKKADTSCLSQWDFIVDSTDSLTVNFFNKTPHGDDVRFLWKFGDGASSMGETTTHTFAASGIYMINLKAYNSTTQCFWDYSKSFVVRSGVSEDCQSEFRFDRDMMQNTIYLRSSSYPFFVPLNYHWSFGDGDTSTLKDPVHTYSAPGVYNICLQTTNPANNCSNLISQSVEIGFDSINCHAAFDYIFTANENEVLFVDKSKGKPTSWLWDFGDTQQSTQKNSLHAFDKDSLYLVKLEVNKPGTISSSMVYNLIDLQSDSNLVGGFGYGIDNNEGKSTFQEVKFYGVSNGSPAKWLWDFGDGTKDSLTTDPIHQFETQNQYNVCLTVSDPIISQSFTSCSVVDLLLLSTENQKPSVVLNAYPNPSNGEIHIQYHLPKSENVTLEIYDILGNLLLKLSDGKKDAGNHNLHYQPDLSSGVYFIHLKTESSAVKLPIVITK